MHTVACPGMQSQEKPNHAANSPGHTYVHRKVRMGGGAPPQPPTPAKAKPSLAAKLAPQGRHAFLEAIYMHTVTCTCPPQNPPPRANSPPYITMHFYAPSKCIWHVVSEKRGSLCLNLAKGMCLEAAVEDSERDRSFLSML